MESSSNTMIQLFKLNGESNWVVWRFQTTVILKGKGLYEIVSGGKIKPDEPVKAREEWDKEDAKAQEIIVTRIEPSQLIHILSCKTGKEMWEKLKSIYDKESVVSVHLLQQKFFSLQYNHTSMSHFISEVEEIKTKLKQAGEEISENMVMTKVIMSLPDAFKHFVSAWESVSSDRRTLTELISRLLVEEERLKSVEKVTALTCSSNKTSNKEGVKNAVKCYVCHKIGHIAKNCFKKRMAQKDKKYCEYCKKKGHIIADCWFRKNKEKETEHKSDVNAFVGESNNKLCIRDWCMDTGASEHMCWDQQLFTNINKVNLNRQVKIGNGSLLKVEGIGTVVLEAWNGQKWIRSELSGVLFVPDLKVNLFSAGRALDKGYNMISDKENCKLIDKYKKVRAIATRKGNLYKMVFRCQIEYETECHLVNFFQEVKSVMPVSVQKAEYENIESENEISECNFVEKFSLSQWHSKLGHQNFEHIKKVLKRHKVEYKSEDSKPMCADCLVGKQHRIHFPTSTSRATKTCELIHSDVCGPFETTSLGGARYFVLFKDDFSNYKHVYFLKHKSEVVQKFEIFINSAEKITENKIKVIRTNNGLEFINRELENILQKKGIQH